MTREDFTEEELIMLKAIFKGAEAFIEAQRKDRYDVYDINTLFDIKQKLGIYELLE